MGPLASATDQVLQAPQHAVLGSIELSNATFLSSEEVLDVLSAALGQQYDQAATVHSPSHLTNFEQGHACALIDCGQPTTNTKTDIEASLKLHRARETGVACLPRS
jgi:hypothetical protein